jgi:ABC-type glycerol-3-phosphate transport system substrate-binding protein
VAFRLARFVAGAALLAAAAACARAGPVVELWSDHPELASYVDAFNAAGGPVKVEITFSPRPGRQLLSGAPAPDLVFGAGLASPELHRLLAPLDRLLANHLAADRYYPDLLAAGTAGGRQLTLPFSFNLPVVVFARAAAPEIGQFLLSAEQIRQLGDQFDAAASAAPEPQPRRVGFSALWNEELIYLLAQARGAGFAAADNGTVAIDHARLAATVGSVHDWLSGGPGGIAGQQRFADAYLHLPLHQLVLDGRMLLFVTDIAAYARLPAGKRELLDFRWLTVDGAIPVLEDYRSFAVPAAADNAAGAELFLRWIYQPEIQTHLLEAANFAWQRGFGLAGGFPALRAVSERILPRSHEYLIGRLPEAALLRVPAPTPVDWAAARQELVVPWLRAAAISGALPPPGQPPLAQAVSRWRRTATAP